jgi:hypothetical protein
MNHPGGLPNILFPDLVRKMTVYKNLFLLSILIAVGSVVAGLTTSVIYFSQFRAYQKDHLQLLQQLEMVQNSGVKLNELETSLFLIPKLDLKKESDRSALMTRMEQVLSLRSTIETLEKYHPQTGTTGTLLPATLLENTPTALLELKRTKAALSNIQSTILETMTSLIQNADLVQKTLLWTVVFTILFGFVAPILILKLTVRLLNSVKDGVTLAAKEFVSHWVSEKAKWGPENHQSAEFYLRFLLMAVEQVSFFVGTRAWRVAGEIARWIRVELLNRETQEPNI